MDFLFPKQCLKCGDFGEYVCKDCFGRFIDIRRSQQCHVCKTAIVEGFVHEKCEQHTDLDGVLVCLDYTDLAERLITEIKYNLYFGIAKYVSGFYLDKAKSLIRSIQRDSLFVPVPIHKKRHFKRGFNQTELISRNLSHSLEVEYSNLIKRTINTRTQVGLSKKQRQENLLSVFEVGKLSPMNANKKVILVDDIMTTGTTLEMCADALRKQGFPKIYAIVMTRG